MAVSPIRAIREKCLDCTCNQTEEIKNCPVKKCPLYAFRFGKNPYIKREMTDEQRKAAAERLARARETKGN